MQERLPGCNTGSLDSYLRGIGFFLLAGEVEPSIRAWWDEDGILWLASPQIFVEVVEQVVQHVREEPPLLRTPWRPVAKGRNFIELRNMAREEELDWFDTCILALGDGSRQNNPLLGEGASFGKGEIAEGHAIALSKLHEVSQSQAKTALVDLVLGRVSDAKAAERLTIENKILSAYQSGRAAVPGSSAKDKKPTSQKSRTLAWDVVLVLRGARLFRGITAKRADPGARVQAAFPFVVQGRPLSTDANRVADQRQDPPGTVELLAPLWSPPCTARALAHLLPSARLRLRRGVARDTIDAVLIQSARAAEGLGFDRLVRFALIPPDPKKPARYALNRGAVRSLGQAAARLALDEIVPFLRTVEREIACRGGSEPTSVAIARRRLENALGAFGRSPARSPGATSSAAENAQEALVSLARLQAPAAWIATAPDRSAPDRSVPAPRLSSNWYRHANDGSPTFRLARALVAGFSSGEGDASVLREALLPQRRDDGSFFLDPARTPPDLERASDPLFLLVELVLKVLRRAELAELPHTGSTRLSDLSLLLSGSLGRDGERRLALLCAALAGVYPTPHTHAHQEDPLGEGIGADVARLLLAAQPATRGGYGHSPSTHEEPGQALERASALASLLLVGHVGTARTVADRELRRRGLDLLPPPPSLTRSPRPAALALAVLFPLDDRARSALERVVTVTPTTSLATQEGGTP